jgi:hypothetical protein
MADEWNQFVVRSKNGTFLFDRRYMDYHSDRFEDCSLMVYRKNRLFALLPGNRNDKTFVSHQGLTYGGFITDGLATAEHVCDSFVAVNAWLKEHHFQKVVYKPVPWIYHSLPADEDLYALFVRCQARLVERDVSSTIVFANRLKFTESRLSGVRKAKRNALMVRESHDVESFWSILTQNLQMKYGAVPVHTASEMRLLKDRFPQQIRLFMTYQSELPLGGTVLYLTPQVVHTQYISASPEGKQQGALDLLFDHLLNEVDFGRPYFDFGTSARENSNEVNLSLIFQKQGFGGRSVCYDWYEYDL